MQKKTIEKTCILLATYNGREWLPDQLDSILNQTYPCLDIYISDDLSTDDTPLILEHYAAKYPNITLLSSRRKFGNAARNFFRLLREIDISQYSYIAFSDQDDMWELHKINLAIQTLKERQADVYSSNIIAFWPKGKSKLINKAQAQTKYDYMFESAGPGCSFVMSKKIAFELQQLIRDKHDSLKNITLHDWFIYAFARSKGYKWYIDPTPTLLYRQHADNVVGANIGIKAIKARLLKLTQGWYLQQVLLIAKSLGYEHSLPIMKVMRLTLWDRCYLAISSHQYRRRFRDRLAFAFFILFLAKKP